MTPLIIALALIVFCLYIVLQMHRNNMICDIRIRWIRSGDSRFDKYSYNEMLFPSLSNNFGLKIPKDSDYK